jgi:hypothetical protein
MANYGSEVTSAGIHLRVFFLSNKSGSPLGYGVPPQQQSAPCQKEASTQQKDPSEGQPTTHSVPPADMEAPRCSSHKRERPKQDSVSNALHESVAL